MEFPITDLLDCASSVAWIGQHFHAGQLKRPRCRCPVTQARVFRRTRRSDLTTYRCTSCGTTYNLHSGTVFQQSHLTPMQIVLFLRGICKGEPTQDLAVEIGLSYQAALRLRHAIQANAQAAQPKTSLPDRQTETDEMFQNAGKKAKSTPIPLIRRANNRRGHGTYDNDRPPIVSPVGRESGQVRLRVVPYTTGPVLEAHVHRFTVADAWAYTDEWPGYRHLIRPHATVCHEINEWARDDAGDGLREVHVNTVEGLWADVRNFLRPFKDVHNRHLSGYVAMAEFRRNQKCVSPDLIAQLVVQHTSDR